MKKILIILLFFLLPIISYAQDGVYAIVKSWRKSNLVSVFNSTHDERYFIGDFFCLKIDKNEKIKEGNYNFLNLEGTKIFGELFIYDEGRTILYEFYVDKIVYSDGRNYSAQRVDKPTK
jgi:hypothetical protein